MDKVFDCAAAVARRVLELGADLCERLAFPRHLARRQMPFRVARHAAGIEVGIAVTNRTTHRLGAMPVRTARDGRLVQLALIGLARAISGGMTIHAAGIRQHPAELGEYRRRPRLGVGDRGKTVRRRQRVRSGLRSRVTGQPAQGQRRDRSENPKPRF
jgi:hypothetical protein